MTCTISGLRSISRALPHPAKPSITTALLLLMVISLVLAGCRRINQGAEAMGDQPDGSMELSASSQPETPPPPSPPCLRAPGSFSEIASRLGTNIVGIHGRTEGSGASGPLSALPLSISEPLLSHEESEGLTEPGRATRALLGTGFLLEANDLVITSAQVIESASQLSVRLGNGQERPAELRGTDPDLDVAVLVLEIPHAEAMTLPDAARIRPGDWIAVLSAPFGPETTVTTGVVRFSPTTGAEGSSHPLLRRFLGIDATVDAANWGGIVVDTGGRLVGLAVSAPRAGSRLGLVLPASQLRRTASQLAQHGHPARTWIGLWVRSLDDEQALELGLNPPRGLLVTRVAPSGPAHEAGIEPDDVIIELSGESVSSPAELGALASQVAPNQSLPLSILRDGRTRMLRLNPAPMPQ